VYDVVRFARERGILCQGRGSAANSVVCYCLFITEVSPEKVSLLFERFISRERDEPPDIDVDFEHERREEVIQYIYEKYSAAAPPWPPPSSPTARAAPCATSARPWGWTRSSSTTWPNPWPGGTSSATWKRALPSRAWRRRGGRASARRAVLPLVQEILGFPRHLSQHVGGFVISRGPISQLVPVENASMPDRTVIQWDKEDIEALGLLKVDVLALGMLSAIRKSLELVQPLRARASAACRTSRRRTPPPTACCSRRTPSACSRSSPGRR
jgi:error-prone DNA polymerase